jgi:HlyD family secretion protein
MLCQVRGAGRLVPEDARWIVAETAGVVEEILLDPGAVVQPGTVILRMANAEVDQAAEDAEHDLERAEAELESRRAELEAERLDRETAVASTAAELHQAQLRARADEELAKKGLISSINLEISRSKAEALETRLDLERRRLTTLEHAGDERLKAIRAEVGRRRALAELRQRQLRSLRARAGISGVVQEIPVEEGQQVEPGASLARVAEPSRLKALLQVPATQARDIEPGQAVDIDIRTGDIPGRVRRIDPSVRQGAVEVEVALEGPVPRGARPDLAVDGTIEIEHLEDVLFVGRPAVGGEGGPTALFRLEPDGDHARRTPVQLGRASVNTVEVKAGLGEGDRVVLSDTSRFDAYDRVRLR